MNEFKERRKNILKALPENSALILSSLPEFFRQPDVPYPYRQDSNFYYLTGFQESKSLFILKKSSSSDPKITSFLFIKNKNPIKELWEGCRYSTTEIKEQFQIEESYHLKDLDSQLTKILKDLSTIFYNNLNPLFDKKIKNFNKEFLCAKKFLAPFRSLKSPTEIQYLTQAVEVTGHAHAQVAKALRPGMNERALHGVFIKSLMEKGSVREGYQSIIASGENATTIHYVNNNSICKENDLLLIDAGGEIQQYTADITRVFPVNGFFSPEQKEIYQKLLTLQKSLIEQVKPGVNFNDLNTKMLEGATYILLEMGFLKGSFEENFENKNYHKYCPHRLGHLLGLDVHDPGFSSKEEFILKESMVITIEPGIYISPDDKQVPEKFRGLGLRIEDNILVTPTGYKNLSQCIPKEIEEIETLCSS